MQYFNYRNGIDKRKNKAEYTKRLKFEKRSEFKELKKKTDKAITSFRELCECEACIEQLDSQLELIFSYVEEMTVYEETVGAEVCAEYIEKLELLVDTKDKLKGERYTDKNKWMDEKEIDEKHKASSEKHDKNGYYDDWEEEIEEEEYIAYTEEKKNQIDEHETQQEKELAQHSYSSIPLLNVLHDMKEGKVDYLTCAKEIYEAYHLHSFDREVFTLNENVNGHAYKHMESWFDDVFNFRYHEMLCSLFVYYAEKHDELQDTEVTTFERLMMKQSLYVILAYEE